MQEEWITVAEARERLGVSRATMANIIKRKQLATKTNELDTRGKLIKRADVEALAAEGKPAKKLAA